MRGIRRRRLLFVLPALAPLAAGAAPLAALDVALAEVELLERLNAARAAAGAAPLSPDPALMALARWRSEDLAARGAFSHQLADGGDVFRLMRERGLHYLRASENLAFNNLDSGHTVARAGADLLASPDHRAAILDPAFDRTGAGVAAGAARRTYYTQLLVQSAADRREG